MKSFHYATGLAIGYWVLAGAYIHVSGRIAASISRNVVELERLEHAKGSAFVIVTALMVWLASWLLFRRLQFVNDQRNQERQALMLVQSKAYAAELAASIAHDFNNLLFVLRASVDDAEANRGVLEPGAIAEMQTALNGAQNLTTRLARAARGDRAGRRERMSLRKAVADTTRLLQRLPRVLDRDLTLVAPSEAFAQLDPVLVDQILVNLVLNAADACGKGGTIRVEVAEDDSHVSLTVEDNGPGFPDSERIAVFEPFRSTKSSGLGLGLLSVRASAEASQGQFSVSDSQLGGAKFTVQWVKGEPSPAIHKAQAAQ